MRQHDVPGSAFRHRDRLADGNHLRGRRLRLNTGGDRGERDDDQLELVRKKLKTFRDRTQPLIAHYAEQGATIIRTSVDVKTQAEDIFDTISAMLPRV